MDALTAGDGADGSRVVAGDDGAVDDGGADDGGDDDGVDGGADDGGADDGGDDDGAFDGGVDGGADDGGDACDGDGETCVGVPECDGAVEPEGDFDRPDGVVVARARNGDGTLNPFADGRKAGAGEPGADTPPTEAPGPDRPDECPADGADAGPDRAKARPPDPPLDPAEDDAVGWAEA
jgi:hypothetical protein